MQLPERHVCKVSKIYSLVGSGPFRYTKSEQNSLRPSKVVVASMSRWVVGLIGCLLAGWLPAAVGAASSCPFSRSQIAGPNEQPDERDTQ